MPLRLHPEATTELAAAAWYERQQLGLGSVFSSAVFRALDTIEASPDTWSEWPGVHHTPPIRRFLLPDFPFAVPYVVCRKQGLRLEQEPPRLPALSGEELGNQISSV
jgi:hypothetical protein